MQADLAGTAMAIALWLPASVVAARSATAAAVRHDLHAATTSVAVGATGAQVVGLTAQVGLQQASGSATAEQVQQMVQGQVKAQPKPPRPGGSRNSGRSSDQQQPKAPARGAAVGQQQQCMAAQMAGTAAGVEGAIAAQAAKAGAAAAAQAAGTEGAAAAQAAKAGAATAAQAARAGLRTQPRHRQPRLRH